MVLTLYKLDASPPVRAVRMVIEFLGIPDVNYVDVNILELEQLKEEFVQLNPQHTIPTLVDDDFVVWDSHAIATYLIAVYGENDSLYPVDPKKRAIIDQRLHFDSGILFSALREVMVAIICGGAAELNQDIIEKINNAYGFMEKFLTTPWLAGDDITVADICCVATISTLKELVAIDEDLYPLLSDWLKRCSELEFYVKGNEPGLLQYREIITSKMT